MTQVALTIDGADVVIDPGATLLEACRSIDKEQPTLCYLETLAPVNVCRVCVVEVEGSRTLVPSCSRKVESGMVVQTESERVRHSRKLVFEMLASSVDLSLVDQSTREWMEIYDVDAERFGPAAPAAEDRDRRHAGHHHPVDGHGAETVHQAAKIDNTLY
ncbi:MAG: 2Fe-2S iron-sulfur cluster-binding protein, partial [bacterium]